MVGVLHLRHGHHRVVVGRNRDLVLHQARRTGQRPDFFADALDSGDHGRSRRRSHASGTAERSGQGQLRLGDDLLLRVLLRMSLRVNGSLLRRQIL